jgi:nitric oxide reductase subunit B
MKGVEQLSRRWTYGVIAAVVCGFAVLILLTFTAHKNAPVVPGRAVDNTGTVVSMGDNIRQGQEVFLKYGLMDSGTIWGHCAYLELISVRPRYTIGH